MSARGPSLHSLQCSIVPAFGVKAAMEGGATSCEPSPLSILRFWIDHLAPRHRVTPRSHARIAHRSISPRNILSIDPVGVTIRKSAAVTAATRNDPDLPLDLRRDLRGTLASQPWILDASFLPGASALIQAAMSAMKKCHPMPNYRRTNTTSGRRSTSSSLRGPLRRVTVPFNLSLRALRNARRQ
jgi:hypothetical protein